jgi:hypothetical protein
MFGVNLNVKDRQYNHVLKFVKENKGKIIQNDKLKKNWTNMYIRFNDEDVAQNLMAKVVTDRFIE